MHEIGEEGEEGEGEGGRGCSERLDLALTEKVKGYRGGGERKK